MKRLFTGYANSGIICYRMILFFSVLTISVACEKNLKPPTVVTGISIEAYLTDADVTGYVYKDGGSPVKSKGICWDTSDNPTTSNNKTDEGEGTGTFTSHLENLSPATLYYARAYATNRSFTSYGAVISFSTRDNIIYANTREVTSLTDISAKSGGVATADIGELITARGVCWGTNPNPTLNDNKTIDGAGAGIFESIITGLIPGTNYYLRAYVTSNDGTVYGNERTFKTFNGTLTDVDDNIYFTLLIGNQEWMVSNLKVTRYRNGDLIGTTDPVNKNILSETEPEYQWPCGGNESWASDYGRLYTWHTAMDSREICPDGSHLPTSEEWSALIDYLGGESYAGGKMKIGLNYYRPDDPGHWYSPNWDATNESGFTAYGTGLRDPAGSFDDLSQVAAWWASTDSSSVKAYYIYCNYQNGLASKATSDKSAGLSVRCIKDN